MPNTTIIAPITMRIIAQIGNADFPLDGTDSVIRAYPTVASAPP
jgi:hypothetical protein